MAYRWGIKNCCSPYEAFPVSLTCGLCMGILNSGVVIPGNAYWLSTVTFDTPQTFYKPDGTTYSPHCWEIIYDSATVMSTVEVTDWTLQAPGSWMHPENDCAALVNPVYGTTPCCPQGTPTFNPNMIVNCCDPSERYQLDPLMYTSVWTLLTGTGPGELGISNSLQAFRADIYIGGASTGYKCWHLEEVDPSSLFGAHAITVTLWPLNKFPDCGHLSHLLTNQTHNNYPPCCPPEPDGCDSNIMTYLQDKVTDFKIIKDGILNP